MALDDGPNVYFFRPHNGRDIQLLSVIREYYHISLPLAILLSL